MTPFIALYGYDPPFITSSLRDSSKVQPVEDHMKHQQQVLQLLKDNLNLTQNPMGGLGVLKTTTTQIDVPEEHQEE